MFWAYPDRLEVHFEGNILWKYCNNEYVKVTRHPLKLWLVDCDKSDTEQKWYFTNYNEDGIPPPPDNTHEEL